MGREALLWWGACAALACGSSACGHSHEVTVGYARAPVTRRDSVAIEVREATEGYGPLRFDLALRGRFGESQAQVGLGLGTSLETRRPLFGDHLVLRALTGVHALELGHVDHAFAFGMGTLYAQGTATFLFSPNHVDVTSYVPNQSWFPDPSDPGQMKVETFIEGIGLTLGVGIEYDVRFTNAQANETVFLFTLGVTTYQRRIMTTYVNLPCEHGPYTGPMAGTVRPTPRCRSRR